MLSICRFLLCLMAALLPSIALAAQVTVKTADLPFENAKTILLSLGDRSFVGLPDDALKQVLQNKGTLTFDDQLLPSDLRATLNTTKKLAEVTATLKTGQDWAEAGQAIGIATRGALSALSDETQKFAATTPGMFLMAVVAWKVAGPDFLRTMKGYFIGVPLLIFWCWLFVWWLRRVYGTHSIKKLIAGEGGKLEKTTEEMPPLSVQWNKDWAEALSKMKAEQLESKAGWSEWSTLAAFKSVGFVVGIFVIVWLVI